jgi:hypothetical protein
MKKLNNQHVSPGALLIAALIASGSVLCHGAITGGLGGGPLAGWAATGDVGMTDAGFASGSPINPTGPVAVASSIDSSVATGFPAASLSGNTPASPSALATALGTVSLGGTKGSGFLSPVSAGQTVSFQWNLFTGDPSGTDYAFYTVHLANTSGNPIHILATSSATPAGANLNYASSPPGLLMGLSNQTPGYQPGSVFVPSGWVLGFGVVDVSNSGAGSVLGIANVSPVPEPWAWSLVSALALGGLAIARRMRVNHA